AEVIQGYQSKVTGEDAATCLRDVLTDLMHFAKSRHLSIEAEFVAACKYFDDEINGRGKVQKTNHPLRAKEEYTQWAASTKSTAASRYGAPQKSKCFWRRCA